MRHFVLRRTAILSRVLAPYCAIAATIPTLAAPQQARPKLTLKDAEAMALRNHPLLQAATFDAEAANQVTREAEIGLLPHRHRKSHGGGGVCPTAALPRAISITRSS